MMNFNFENTTLIENHALSATEMKSLIQAKNDITEMYQRAREEALQPFITKMKVDKQTFTLPEIAKITGLTYQAVASVLRGTFGIRKRSKIVEETYCKIKNGRPDFNSTITIRKKINEYYFY